MDFFADEKTNLSTEHVEPVYTPKPPDRLNDLDIPQVIVEDLLLRYLYTKGSDNIRLLCDSIKLPFSLIHDLFQNLRKQQLFEVTGMEGNDYNFILSEKGRDLAAKRFGVCHYVGPAPVSLKSYHEVVEAQSVRLNLNRSLIRKALSGLVLTDIFLDQLGPALISQKPIFLYGPTGNGKTSVAERLLNVFEDSVVVPYAVEYDGQIIVVYDAAMHESLENNALDLDQRWVVCRRPCIITGGELVAKMLDLQMEASSMIYAAPLQMRANNGLMIIDDFGRQNMPPDYLLNRWIVPLDRRVDYLTLQYGLKFKIPFEMMVVFSTNLNPIDLADEAFLRRIKNKIYVEPVRSAVFEKIFLKLACDRGLACDNGTAEFARKLCQQFGGEELRACYPVDILDVVASISNYDGRPVELSRENLKLAADLYFTRTHEVPVESVPN